MSAIVLLDDRLLIEELLVGLNRPEPIATTSYWYYRACRAAVAGAGGHLSGPFTQLGVTEQQRAVASLLELRDDIALPDSRTTVPTMVDIATRHPKLNLLNLEATAAARELNAVVLLSPAASSGILPSVLDAEEVQWEIVVHS